MDGIYPCVITTSMYSKIPTPTMEWIQERMRYVVRLFPMVGIVEGLAMGAQLYAGLDVLGFAPWITALVRTCAPVLVTGGIHMDGFLDTMDALHSYGDRPKKPEILKDPHLGAFTVISATAYMMLCLEVANKYVLLLASRRKGTEMVLYAVSLPSFMTERAFSDLSVVWFPPAKKNGLTAGFARTFKKKLDRLALILWLVPYAVLATVVCLTVRRKAGILAAFMGGVRLLVFGWYCRVSVRKFGGITDDLTGCFLQICKLTSFRVLVILVRTGGFVLRSW